MGDAPATLGNIAPEVLYVENRTQLEGATPGLGSCLKKGEDCKWGLLKCCSGYCSSTSGPPKCVDAPATLGNIAPEVLYVENRTQLEGATPGLGSCLKKGEDCKW